jgi:DNA-binding transcriptional regulator YhcF (GntR family)
LAIDFIKPIPLYLQIVNHIISQKKSQQLRIGGQIGSHNTETTFRLRDSCGAAKQKYSILQENRSGQIES